MTSVVHRTLTSFALASLIVGLSGCPADRDVSAPPDRTDGSPAAETTEAKPVKEPAAKESVETSQSFRFVKPELTEEELRAGWISLFDGSTLFGWDVPATSNWHVEDGCIVADSGERSLLLTPFTFGDFELRCDFHLAKGGNSGVFLRTAEAASDPTKDTYELNICDSHESHPTGSLVGRYVAEDVPASEDAWHTFHIRCEGKNISVRLDDKPIVDFQDDSDNIRLNGRIGLQMNQGRIAFRNVFLRPLNVQPVFNGQDLTGFREVADSKSTFSVRDGAIHGENGPGFLETETAFGDFILHVEARIYDEKAIADGRPANSGVFFRCMPGTAAAPSNGYEMQIQNDFVEGDRSRPLDFGTGAIYRRERARYVVADNNEWFVETLIAQGPRFATFVNGFQVLDWTDQREPDENPRKGSRLAAGHLSLQGHDPTTDLDFRAIRIHELAAPQ